MTNKSDAELIVDLQESRRQLLEDNRRLRRLLDQRDASGELRHRLQNTLALLRAVIRESANTERDLPSYVNQLGDRLDAISRAQAQADQYGEVNLRTLLLEEFFQYEKHEDEKLVLSGPDVRLQPKFGQILGLALHELAVNTVEYGALGTSDGCIEVIWSVADTELGPQLRLTWTEHGPMIDVEPTRRGFGTKVLTRVLAYNIGAETDLVFNVDKFSCTIRFLLSEQIGRIHT